jgi:hypothetical protein
MVRNTFFSFAFANIYSQILGRNKLLINHLGRLFVTSDAATIIREIEVVHPAAKLLVMASQAQESEASSAIATLFVDVLHAFSDGRFNEYGNHTSWRVAQEGRASLGHGSSP